MVKMSLSKIMTRAKVVDHVDFARSNKNIDGLEQFYRINLSYRVSENSIFEYTRKPGEEWNVVEKSLGEFIERFTMHSRWYLL